MIECKERKNHNKNLADSRFSLTMYSTGSVAVKTRPTGILLGGKQKRLGYTNDFLKKHGASEGLTTEITETDLMTEVAWNNITPHMFKGFSSK